MRSQRCAGDSPMIEALPSRPREAPTTRACPLPRRSLPRQQAEEQPTFVECAKLAPQLIRAHAAPSVAAFTLEAPRKALPHWASRDSNKRPHGTVVELRHLTKHPNGGSSRRLIGSGRSLKGRPVAAAAVLGEPQPPLSPRADLVPAAIKGTRRFKGIKQIRSPESIPTSIARRNPPTRRVGRRCAGGVLLKNDGCRERRRR